MKPTWVLQPIEPSAQALASELKIHPILASLLSRRGLTDAASAHKYLNPTLADLESPYAFTDMPKAVARIRKAIQDKQSILLFGDYDVDGVTASAVVYPVLKKLGAQVEAYIPHRVSEGYGLSLETATKLAQTKPNLLITLDNGITGKPAIDYLQTLGIDVIIVDHHLPKGDLPLAHAIISASLDGKGDPTLAACGLAFKLVWALLDNLEAAKECLDIVVIGTVADVAPVHRDNRVILKHGLPILSRSDRPGIKALIQSAGISRRTLGYRDIAFGLAPRINASGRMGSADAAFKLLTTDNALLAQNLAKMLDDGNKNRQRIEAAAFEEALAFVEAERMGETDAVLVVANDGWHEGVIGIVAARLVERYHRPSLVFSLKNGVGKASGRSVHGFSIFDCVQSVETMLKTFGGHAQAIGLTIESARIPEFRRQVNEAARKSGPVSGDKQIPIAGDIRLDEIDHKLIQDLDRLAPFGNGNEKPYFVARNCALKGEPNKRGRDTLQCWVTDNDRRKTCEVIGFRAYDRWIQGAKKPTRDIVFWPALKEYNGIISIQLELVDWN